MPTGILTVAGRHQTTETGAEQGRTNPGIFVHCRCPSQTSLHTGPLLLRQQRHQSVLQVLSLAQNDATLPSSGSSLIGGEPILSKSWLKMTTCGPSLELNPSPKPLLTTRSPGSWPGVAGVVVNTPSGRSHLMSSNKFRALDSGDGLRSPSRPHLSSVQAAAPEQAGNSSAATADHALNLLPPDSNAAKSRPGSHGWTAGY